MKIQPKEIPIRKVIEGYINNQEEGVLGYKERLDIRPPYQRAFVYNNPERNAVIKTVLQGFPLNSIYWVKNGKRFEVLDGQQRLISICEYVQPGGFSITYRNNPSSFDNLTKNEKKRFLDYKLNVYICDGNDTEKLDWFKTINIAGKVLTAQELRNAVYTGPWLSAAKEKFSKKTCKAYNTGSDYINAKVIRQEYLETALKWIAHSQDKYKICKDNDERIKSYMNDHCKDENADALWDYFQSVIKWVERVFTTYRSEMKGLPWGILYNQYKDMDLDPDEVEKKISTLLQDDDVTSHKGIYFYVFDGHPKHLNIRAFDKRERRMMYERQDGTCADCKKKCDIKDMEADHIIQWQNGGPTVLENGRMLCRPCHNDRTHA